MRRLGSRVVSLERNYLGLDDGTPLAIHGVRVVRRRALSTTAHQVRSIARVYGTNLDAGALQRPGPVAPTARARSQRRVPLGRPAMLPLVLLPVPRSVQAVEGQRTTDYGYSVVRL